MNSWLIQLVLAARNRSEDDGWSQILVFVILAVFYAVGSIISKAKKGATNGKEQKPGKPVRKQPELTIDLRMLKQLFGLPEEPEEAESSIQAVPEEPKPQAAKPQVSKPQVQPTARKVVRPQPAAHKMPIEVPKIAPKKVAELSAEAAPEEISQSNYLSEILSDYDDSEKLRRVILHYEILGKPLSLRESSERLF